MALLRYLTKGKSALPDKSTCPSLTRKEVDSANECVKDSLQQQKTRDENSPRTVTSLPTKPQGRPVLLGQVLDEDVQEYVRSQRAVGGAVNTAIVRADAEGIILARDRSLLVKYGGHIDLTKSWAKSLLHRMGYSK